MSTFADYTGLIDAGDPLAYSQFAYKFGPLRKRREVEIPEFSAAVASLAHLERHYEEEPVAFLQKILAAIDPRPVHGSKELYLVHCKVVFSLHVYNYLANQSALGKIPSKKSPMNELKRLEFKWLIAKLYADDLLEGCTYRVIQENCPELYCRREFIEDPSDGLAPSEESSTSEGSSDED